MIGFHIGNEFHNVKMYNWRTERAGKPFWDATTIGNKEAGMSIEEIDRIAGRGYPEVAVPPPDSVKMSVVDAAIELVGEDHVALGSNFDGGPTLPIGMRDIGDLPMLTDAMPRRGYSEQRSRKFLGGNLLRVFAQITEKA